MYLRDNPALADEFVDEYLKHRAVEPGFAERQQMYMVYDSAIIWSFWQGYAGGLPEDKSMTFESWASSVCRVLGQIQNTQRIIK